jgi:hypothetical protein
MLESTRPATTLITTWPDLAWPCPSYSRARQRVDARLKAGHELEWWRDSQSQYHCQTTDDCAWHRSHNALAHASTLDDPARFGRCADVGAYLGLTPDATNPERSHWPARLRSRYRLDPSHA